LQSAPFILLLHECLQPQRDDGVSALMSTWFGVRAAALEQRDADGEEEDVDEPWPQGPFDSREAAQAAATQRDEVEHARRAKQAGRAAQVAAKHPCSCGRPIVEKERDGVRHIVQANRVLAPLLQALLQHFFPSMRGTLLQLQHESGAASLRASSVLLLPRLSPFLGAPAFDHTLVLACLNPSRVTAAQPSPLAFSELEAVVRRLNLTAEDAAVANTGSDSSSASCASAAPVGGTVATPTGPYAFEPSVDDLRAAGVAPLLWPAFFRQQMDEAWNSFPAAETQPQPQPRLSDLGVFVLQLYFEAAVMRVLYSSSRRTNSLLDCAAELALLLPPGLRESLPIPLLTQEPRWTHFPAHGAPSGLRAAATSVGDVESAARGRPSEIAEEAQQHMRQSVSSAAKQFPSLYRRQVAAAAQARAQNAMDDGPFPDDDDECGAPGDGVGSRTQPTQSVDPLAANFVPADFVSRVDPDVAAAAVAARRGTKVRGSGPRLSTQLQHTLLQQMESHARHIGVLTDDLFLNSVSFTGRVRELVSTMTMRQLTLSAPFVAGMQMVVEAELRRVVATAFELQRQRMRHDAAQAEAVAALTALASPPAPAAACMSDDHASVDVETSILVTNLTSFATEAYLRDLFSRAGTIVRYARPGVSEARLTYARRSEAQFAEREWDEAIIDSESISIQIIEPTKPRTIQPNPFQHVDPALPHAAFLQRAINLHHQGTEGIGT
jgi:hypothetical protein